MKKLFTLPVIIFLILPYSIHAQGIKKESNDPLVASMEANRKTAAPFSILFKEESAYKAADAPLLFTKYLTLRSSTDELILKNKDVAGDIAVSHFQQYFRGIKVMHGSYALTSKNDKVSFITGDFYTVDENTNIEPSLSEAAALSKALSYINASVYKWQLPGEEAFIKQETGNPAATYYPKGELVLVENFMNDGLLSGKVFLAYKFNVYAQEPLSRTDIYVDAVSGKILLTDAVIKHGNSAAKNAGKNNDMAETAIDCSDKSIFAPEATGTAASKYSGNVTIPTRFVTSSYQLLSSVAAENYPLHTRNMKKGTAYGSATEFTDVDNNWTAAEFDNATFDNVAIDAHWGASKVFDYWKNRHSRNSYDNAGAVINSYVHYSNNYDNAYWDGVEMTYGDGSRVNGGFLPLTALDVCGHEIGHAVCSYVVGAGAGLTYNRESGAMNEGFSDIWGAAIEHYSDPFESDGSPKSYFNIGEEIGLPLQTPLRSMSNPNLYGQPDTYLGTSWVDATTAGCPTPNSSTNDNCGVHTNSGVLNYWFYLLVSGGTGANDLGNSFVVPALGWVDAEKITFLGEQNLTTTANYAACRTAMINAATTLFGACSLQTEAVTRAWYAVGVGANFTPCTAQIGFRDVALTVNESAGVFTCPASKTLTIRMMVEGPTPTGGNAAATVTATGTAVNGKDYTLATGTATFAAGSTADQNIVLNIIDDAAVEGNENITLDFTVTPNGSTATKTNAYKQSVITIIDNDSIPETGTRSVTNFVGTPSITSNVTSPFKAATKTARSQFIWTQAELIAAGVRPNAPITAVSFQVTTKNSAQTYTGYTLSFANTAQASMTAYVAGLTTAYSADYTTVLGTNTITLTTPFTWDGTSNLVMQACFTNATAGTANDLVYGFTASAVNYTGLATGTTSGCALTALSLSPSRPYTSFTQTVPPVKVESSISSARSQIAYSGANSYFYSSADNEVIAGVTANNNDLDCVTASLTGAGAGFTALASSPTVKRSLKEVTITPTINGGTTNYDATIYFTDAELAGKSPATLLLLKTNAATDAQINGTNTVTATPTVISGTNYKGFTGNFTSFSRFYLIDNAIALAVRGLSAEAYLQNGLITLNWKTETETNSDHFIIERSYDGVNFSEIKQVNASGNSGSQKHYSIIDNDMPRTVNYYRVRLVNTNGSTMTSPIVSVKTTAGNGIAIMPNPVVDRFVIQYSGKGIISIMDATGRRMQQLTANNSAGSISIDAANYSAGIYIVTFTDESNHLHTEKFIKK